MTDIEIEIATLTRPAPLIGLLGRKRSGKDTLAAVLVEEGGFRRVAFADPLRQACLDLDPIVGTFPLSVQTGDGRRLQIAEWRLSDVISAIGWEKGKDYVPEVRRTLDRLGTNVVRKLDEGLWARLARESLGSTPGTPVVVTDVRFPNEARLIADRGGRLVRIVRPSIEEAEPTLIDSQMDAYPVDDVVENVGTLADLQDAARRLL